MTVNPTVKPELSRKIEDIYDFSITIPITDAEGAGPTLKLEKLTFYIKDNIPDIAAQVPITDYDTAS
ncbi:3407_t:CDS:2 [Gigaspora margarita]|uniref:3407_t:CDS:1 n=1 Tax=Gigaspora margarita TaxID=4874 RepID=A0ABN7WPL0_GIGMA|nr:3407_t:CDS:2 [Gigaspora margarita]